MVGTDSMYIQQRISQSRRVIQEEVTRNYIRYNLVHQKITRKEVSALSKDADIKKFSR